MEAFDIMDVKENGKDVVDRTKNKRGRTGTCTRRNIFIDNIEINRVLSTCVHPSTGPDLRRPRGPGPQAPTNREPPTKPFILFLVQGIF